MTENINLGGKTFYEEYIEKEYQELVGKTITGVRPLTKDEMDELMWDDYSSEVAFVVLLSDGTFFIPMRDDEGNGPGTLLMGETTARQMLFQG